MSSRVRQVALLVVVIVVTASCSTSHHATRAASKSEKGQARVTVANGGRVSVGGAAVTVPPGGVDRAGVLRVRVVQPASVPPGTSLVTPAVEVSLDGALLTKPAIVELPINASVDATTVLGAFFDAPSGAWTPLVSKSSISTRVLHIATPHFSIFGGIHIDPRAIIEGIANKVKDLVSGRAGTPQPTCTGEQDARADGVTVKSDSGDLVKWCFGMSGGQRVLTVTNNRSAAVTVTYPSAWSRGNVTGSGFSFESVGRWLSSNAPPPPGYAYVVVGGGGSIVLRLPDGYANGRVSVEMDILTWAFSGFDVAVSASLAIYEKFLKVTDSKDAILVGALTKGEAKDSVDFFSCMNSVFGGDIDPRKSVADAGFEPAMQAVSVAIKCGFGYLRDWIKNHVKNLIVGTVLSVVSAALGFVVAGLTAAFTGMRYLYDTAKGATQYTIAVAGGTIKPTVEHTGNGEYTLRFTHPGWGPVRLVTRMASDNESGPGPASITVYDASGQVRFSWHASTFYRLRPAGTGRPIGTTIYGSGHDGVGFAFDKLGHIFINFDPGRLNGVIVLRPTLTGFANFGSLPPENDYEGRFYSAAAVDPDHDGIYEIEVVANDCEPSCAAGTETSTAYKWDGSNYKALVPPKVDTSDVLYGFLTAWKSRDMAAQLRYATTATVATFNRQFPSGAYKSPRRIDLQRCPLTTKRAAACEILLDPASGGYASIVQVRLHQDGFGKVDVDTLTSGGDAG